MQRVLIIGSSGAGKSTLATRIAEKLHLPVIHLDTEYWQPGWTVPPEENWREKVAELVARDRWVMDGNYSGSFDLRMPRADMIVWLDPPTWICLLRALKRAVTLWGRTRPDMAPGCPEKFDLEFFLWILNFRRTHLAKNRAAIDQYAPSASLAVLRSDAEVAGFLETLAC